MKEHILYSFRRCPYAIRVRWALLNCGIKVELREVNLRNKPKDLIEKSKKKTVPLMILNGGDVINESLDIILWALSNSSINCMEKFFRNRNQKEILNIIKENDNVFKFHLDGFKYSNRFDKSNEEYHFEESIKILIRWNRILLNNPKSKNYFFGEDVSIADWCIWPFVRQFKIACESKKMNNYLPNDIKFWLKQFEEHQNFPVLMYKYQPWQYDSKKAYFPPD